MQITANTKLADVIHLNYQLLPILNRFGIQLGFGDKTVEEVCIWKGINKDFFLEVINSFHDKNYFPQAHLQSFPIQLILDYVHKTHEYYMKVKIPQIEKLIEQLIEEATNETKSHLEMVRSFFREYIGEVLEHLLHEENTVHPYIKNLSEAYQSNNIQQEHRELIEQNSIEENEEEHTDIENKLFDLKNIIIKYLRPSSNNLATNSLLFELFRFERDLNDHARMEDKVLVPKVKMIEQEILGK